jgi:hypothetical protein
MTLTLLIVAAAAVMISAAYVVAVRTAEPALAGEHTLSGLADPAAETLRSTGDRLLPHVGTDWQLTDVNDLTAAEDLLDLLENQGYAERELVVLGNSSFAVRWR